MVTDEPAALQPLHADQDHVLGRSPPPLDSLPQKQAVKPEAGWEGELLVVVGEQVPGEGAVFRAAQGLPHIPDTPR